MVALFFLVAVFLMVIGHVFKCKRWSLLISVYEPASYANLLNSMTIGHTLNVIFPIRIGDIFRVALSGRKLKNGYSFALATVIVDLYVDLITVGGMFFGLSIIGKGGPALLKMAHFYMWIFVVIIPSTIICVCFRKYIKEMIMAFATLFNEKIQFRILYISYLCIASLKDLIYNIKKTRFILYTLLIWSGYVLSYVVFAEAIQKCGFYYSTSDVFTSLFSGSSLYSIEAAAIPLWASYLLLPLCICWVLSIVIGKIKPFNEELYSSRPLPQLSVSDRLAFLKTYYSEENRDNIQSYLEINKDVSIIKDYSAGSNASTVLTMKTDGNMYFRKYAFNEDGQKLKLQIDWIKQHQQVIPLPCIVDERSETNFVTYDMHAYSSATGLFEYIHTMPIENSWKILKHSLESVRTQLHVINVKNASTDITEKYIKNKVRNNIKIICEEDKYIKLLEQYDSIIVNGRELPTLQTYTTMLSDENLLGVFKNDKYSDIHGDMTIENIVCLSNSLDVDFDEYNDKILPEDYYFIDPNTGNLHNSPFLDYAKLLQSLHGNYEFLMMVKSVTIQRNHVTFLETKSEACSRIYEKYSEYLKSNFTDEQILSIYYHEVIHWLRLMPYKIRKDEKLAVVFYTGLLSVINDVQKMDDNNEK